MNEEWRAACRIRLETNLPPSVWCSIALFVDNYDWPILFRQITKIFIGICTFEGATSLELYMMASLAVVRDSVDNWLY